MKISYPLEHILELIGESELEGTTTHPITGFASLSKAKTGDLSFLGNKKYTIEVASCQASVILLPASHKGSPMKGQVFIRVENPSLALAQICADVETHLWPKKEPTIHPSAVISKTAKLGASVHMGPGCVVSDGAIIGDHVTLDAMVYIGREVELGADSRIRPNVTISDYCILGKRVHIHPGVVIGSDGFGYETTQGVHHKVPQIGNVVIEDDVEIGANTTIDRARFDSTRIGRGVKIDNLVQIAHNCDVGEHCILVSQTGISGSTTLERHVVMAGQSGAAGHLVIGEGAVVGAKTGVSRSLPGAKLYRGIPAIESSITNKVDALKKRLPDLFKRVSRLEAKMESK